MRIKSEVRGAVLLLMLLGLAGCAGELTPEKAADAIGSQTEFQQPFCAPLHLAPQVLTGENYNDPNAYVRAKYGPLLDAGLVEVQLGGKNSWRTILRLGLTEKGKALEDASRTVDDMAYVEVCRLKVDSILSLEPLGAGDTVLCRYRIVQRELTPFGEYLGFMDGKFHVHERRFAKGTFGWSLVPIEP